jgi:hypothetical protein
MPIRFNPDAVLRKITSLQASVPSAVKRALTRSMTSSGAAISRAIAKDMGLTVGTVKDQIRSEIVDTADEGIVGQLSISGKRIPLIDFKGRGPEPSRGLGKVTASVGGRRTTYPSAFITTVGVGGHRGIFKRVGSGARRSRGAWSPNLPIVELKGPSLPHVFNKQTDVAIKQFEQRFPIELEREVSFALKKVASS